MKTRITWKSTVLAGVLALSLLAGCASAPANDSAPAAVPEEPQAEVRQETGVPDGALVIAGQGMFSAGGTVITSDGTFDVSNYYMSREGSTSHVDHANVFYQIPAEETGLPMVFLHGYGQSRMGWMTTPDGRPGWSDLFLKMGHSVFLIDQPRRGEAGQTSVAGTMTTTPSDQTWYTQFRIGTYLNHEFTRNEGSQFPQGEEALDQFLRQMTPDTGMDNAGGDQNIDNTVVAQAVAATIDEVYRRTGKDSILVTHSQGGMPGWETARYTDHIAAIVAIEPGMATLGGLHLTWYSHIDPAKTVEIANYMRTHAEAGDTIFYDIYTDAEKAADSAKENTGLFFFKGSPGERFAVCNAGGGFAYVGAMHDSFPHALELSKMGYNAFALIYRPGAQTACEDLAQAIAFIFEHADELEVETSCYSLWGGSAGGRMAAYLGSYGPMAFGGGDLPRPGVVITQYTGHSEYTENDPPTYACVGSSDGIASWRTMERRLEALDELGIPTEFHVYEGLGHGFGLGTGTVAQGWIQNAVSFWEDRFVTPGRPAYQGFTVDNVFHAGEKVDIHYNVYVPESYDGSKPYALFFTLPGYEGLYFQGAAANLRSENFGFEAQKYHKDMIVVAPQLSDWGETSADQTIALAEYFLKHYNIDTSRVYANGYSGGGETMSIVLGKRPELFTAYLHCSSQWDGDLKVLAESRTPVYLVVGQEDEYYGSEPSQKAYDTLHGLYREQGLSEEEISSLLVLDIKDRPYFTGKGINNEHGGGNLFAADGEIMGWLFSKTKKTAISGTIPEELEYVPEGYTQPSSHPGTLERLEYQTWESLSYEDHTKPLTKTAWVYLPYGYSENAPYNVLYLSHGGWSDETAIMGTPGDPHAFKHIVDHAIEDGKIQPLIIVLPTYNNTSESDSGDYSLALRLTSNFHNELLNDLIPAVESKYSTYAASTDAAGLAASRDHRAFGGFSMGSMNTWHTFEHCLDYFRYFAPSSGGPLGDGEAMANLVRNSGHSPEDFFLFTASGTEDFAYSGFKGGVMAMAETDMFTLADKEEDGNLSFREREGYAHDGSAANEYMYNALRFFWNAGAK